MGVPTEESPSAKPSEGVGGDYDPSEVAVQFNDTSSRTQFVGLCKEELTAFENDPFWKKIRLGLFIGFWAIWCILLIAAILILVYTPPCPETVNTKWVINRNGYALNLKNFVYPLLGNENASISEQISALNGKLSYIKEIGFGYIIIYSEEMMNRDLYKNSEVANSLKSLRTESSELGLKLVLQINNNNNTLCTNTFKNCENLSNLLNIIIKDFDFDGLQLSVSDDNFPARITKDISANINAIGKSTLKEKCFLTKISSSVDNVTSDLKISIELYKWKSDSLANNLIDYIKLGKNCNAFVLDNIDNPRIIDREIYTDTAIHVIYLLPSASIVNYGTESSINSRQCRPPLMNWNGTSYTLHSTNCSSQDNIKITNVYQVSTPGYPNSPYRLLQKLNEFRQNFKIFTFGNLWNLKSIGDNIVYWEIRYNLYNVYVVSINLGKNGSVVPLDASDFSPEQPEFTVIYSTSNAINIDDKIVDKFYLDSGDVIVLKSTFLYKSTASR